MNCEDQANTNIPIPPKTFFSYADIHNTLSAMVPQLQAWKPDVILAIGGGGFIPARILRTELKVPIVAVSLELYDAATNTARKTVVKNQWFDENSPAGSLVREKRVLIVDEVDDTRTTLQYCAEEIVRDHNPCALAVCVVHNKIKPKKGRLDRILVSKSLTETSGVEKLTNNTVYFPVKYFAGKDVEDKWNCYPWDAAAYGNDINMHEQLSKQK